MKTKFIFKSIGCILASIIMLQIAPCSFAHTTSQKGILAQSEIKHENYSGYYVGGENIGWSIDEQVHTNGTKIYYTLSGNEIQKYKDDVSSAAHTWSGIVEIANKTLSAPGKIYTYYDPKDSASARTNFIKTDKYGHLTEWEIKINLAYSVSSITIAHEFGHVIGLNDLYESINENKLMCGYRNVRTAIRPMTTDLWGAMVITGQHTNHKWGYKFYSTTGNGTNHIIYCTECYGYLASYNGIDPVISNCTYSYKYYSTTGQGMNSHVKYCTGCNHYSTVSACTYNSKNVCTYCGIPKGASPYIINQKPQ